MKLSAVELSEFRGWPTTRRVDLSSDVVLVHGPNGSGKTSLFDAILWTLTGALGRMPKGHHSDVISMYGDTGLARVRVDLVGEDASIVGVTRSYDGRVSSLQLERKGETLRGAEAIAALQGLLWPSSSSIESMDQERVLARSVYLQ